MLMKQPRSVLDDASPEGARIAPRKGILGKPRVRRIMPFMLGLIWGTLTSFAFLVSGSGIIVQTGALGLVSVLALNCWPSSFTRSLNQPIVFAVALYATIASLSGILYDSSPSSIMRSIMLLPATLALTTGAYSGPAAMRGLARGFASAGLIFVAVHLAYIDPSKLLDPTYRIYVFLNPNGVAFISGATAIVMLDWTLSSKGIRAKAICLIGMAAALLVLFATKSRTAAASTLIGIMALLFFAAGRGRLHGILILICAILLGLSASGRFDIETVGQKLSSMYSFDSNGRSILTGTGRLRVWQFAATDILGRHTLLGIGPDNYRPILKRKFPHSSGSVHNGLLRTLLDSGILGTFPLLLIILASAKTLAFRRVRRDVSLEAGLFCIGIVESLAEEFFFSFGNPASLLFLLAMISLSLKTTQQRNVRG
jgi:hypothetical protein